MIIRLTDIPPEGLIVNDTLALENLNARMNEGPDNDIEFITAPEVSLTIKKEKGGAEVKGTASSSYRQVCPKCTEEVEHEVKSEITLILKPKTSQPGKDRQTSSEEWNDDIGIVYFDGEHIDLEDVIQETLILQLSPYGMPHEGCQSLLESTPQSDEDLQGSKTNLGKLLKDAGVH